MPLTRFSVQCNDIFVVMDDGRVGIDEYRLLEDQLRQQKAAFPRGLGCIVLLSPGAALQGEEIHGFFSSLLDWIGVKALVYVVEGQGFRASSMRVALLGMRGMQRKAFPVHVVTSLGEAAAWLTAKMPPNPARGDLAAEIEHRVNRARLGAAYGGVGATAP